MRAPRRTAMIGVLVGVACSSGALRPPVGARVTGAWGGDHIQMSLTDSGGQIEYDCARGSINEPLLVDANGSFVVAGFHFPGHGGPVRINEPVDSISARYSGTIRDNVMQLDVQLPSTVPERYSLVKDGAARIFRCL